MIGSVLFMMGFDHIIQVRTQSTIQGLVSVPRPMDANASLQLVALKILSAHS